MAAMRKPYGDKRVSRGSEGFIAGALTGDTGGHTADKSLGPNYQNSSTSNEIIDQSCGRPNQKLKTAFALDNVGRVYGRPASSIKDMSGWPGGVDNLKHSLSGSSAVNEEVGAAGSVKHVIIPNH